MRSKLLLATGSALLGLAAGWLLGRQPAPKPCGSEPVANVTGPKLSQPDAMPPPAPAPAPKAKEPAAPREVAPMPRDTLETKVWRAHYEQAGKQEDSRPYAHNGVEWSVKAKMRRLTSGAEVIDLNWSIKATSPRSPLIILEPSLDNANGETTKADVFAFPKGSDRGRAITLTTEQPPFWATWWGGREPLTREWFLTVERGKTATGTMSIAVSQIKRELLTFYPAEFSEAVPPKLYVVVQHNPLDRGSWYDLDAWTGALASDILDIPELTKW